MKSILREFGQHIGLENLDFGRFEDNTGICTLSFDDVTVSLAYNGNERVLYAHTAIARVPENDKHRLELYTLLLEINCGFRFTEGGIIGVHDEYGVILTNTISMENLSTSIFEKFIEKHVNFAEKMYAYLLENNEAMAAEEAEAINDKDVMKMMSLAIRI